MLAEGILILKMFVFVFNKESITHRLLPACWGMYITEGRKIQDGHSNSYIEIRMTTSLIKDIETNRQKIVNKSQHRKIQTMQHETHPKSV